MSLAWHGTFPNLYVLHVRGITAPQPYPLALMAIELVLAAIAFAAVGWALTEHSWQRVWRTCLCGALAGAIGVCAALGAMHMPNHYVYFAAAMLVLSALCIILGIAYFVAEAIRKVRGH